jgi:hypothetical protein
MQFATARGWEDLSEILYAYEALGIVPDAELAVQYVQMPAVARDFQNYYALYNKYRQVYHIDDILHGCVPKVTLSEFAAAPFDERLAVMGLLLSKLAEAARNTRQADALCKALYDTLSAVKQRMEREDPAEVLREIEGVRRAALKRAAAAGQDDKELRNLRQAEINAIEAYRRELDSSPEEGAEARFALVKALFGEETAKAEALAEEAGAKFDNAFRFLEAAIGQSQELVLFVTEITAGYDSSWFVSEFGCDAYFRNNRDLLFDETRQNLLDRLGRA